jgi:hypothetical protein
MAAPLSYEEEICPQCGQPMLRAWGASCGTCRAPLGYARANDQLQMARRGERRELCAWLLVVDTPDASRAGEVVSLTEPITIVTRASAVAGVAGEVPLRDDFMSAGHAVITRLDGEGRFTLEDRRDPGPSANGTFLNARRLAPGEAADLCDHDEIRVGSTELVFRNLALPEGPR